MANLSKFPAEYDVFQIHTSISESDLPLINRFQYLRLKENKTQAEIDELNNLLTNPQFRPKLFLEDDLTKLEDSMSNMQVFVKDKILNYYKYRGNYDNSITYTLFNSVTYTDGCVYMLFNDTNYTKGVLPTDTNNWIVLSKKGEKGTQWRGVYNDSKQYFIDDIIFYNGSTYICISNCKGILPTNETYFNVFTLKGEQGQNGADGIGLIFKGEYRDNEIYNRNDGVQYLGSVYAPKQDGVSGIPPSNSAFWSLVLAKGASVLVSELRKTITLTEDTSNISILGGEITAFNKNTDGISVFKNSVYIEKGSEYNINANGTSIDKISGSWSVGTVFNIKVTKNVIQPIQFNDGQLIDNESITLNKLSLELQQKIDDCGIRMLSNSFTVTSNTTTLEIGIADFNPLQDYIRVYIDGGLIVKDKHFTIGNDNMTLVSKDGNWLKDSEVLIEVIKKVAKPMEYYDSGLIENGSINKFKLSQDMQDTFDEIKYMEEKLDDYIYDVVTSDSDGKPIKATYKRTDNTLYKEVTCSNKDVNGFYQTIVEKTFNKDGVTLLQTKTYTLTYNADGIVLTKRWVIS